MKTRFIQRHEHCFIFLFLSLKRGSLITSCWRASCSSSSSSNSGRITVHTEERHGDVYKIDKNHSTRACNSEWREGEREGESSALHSEKGGRTMRKESMLFRNRTRRENSKNKRRNRMGGYTQGRKPSKRNGVKKKGTKGGRECCSHLIVSSICGAEDTLPPPTGDRRHSPSSAAFASGRCLSKTRA